MANLLLTLRNTSFFSIKKDALGFMQPRGWTFLTQSFNSTSFGYFPFKCANNFIEFANSYLTPHDAMCEIIAPESKVKLYFDLDGYIIPNEKSVSELNEFSESCVDKFVSMVDEELRGHLPENVTPIVHKHADCRLVTKTLNSGEQVLYKLSYHIIFDNVLFRDNHQHLKGFVHDKILNNPKFHRDESDFQMLSIRLGNLTPNFFVDCAVYSKFRAMRIVPAFSKWTSHTEQMGDARVNVTRSMLIQADDEEAGMENVYLVDYEAPRIFSLNRPPNIHATRSYNNTHNTGDINNNESDVSETQEECVGLITSLLRANGDTTSVVCFNGGNSFYIRNGREGRPCLCSMGVIHHSNNAIVRVENGYIVYICLASECRRNARYLNLSPLQMECIGQDNAMNERPLHETYRFMNISYKDDEYVSASMDFTEHCLCVCASMGSGKTTFISKYLLHHKFDSFAFITCRISLANSLFDTFTKVNQEGDTYFEGVKIYNDSGVYGRDGQIHHKKLIIQYESLYKLSRSFDVIIIDEFRSLLNCVVSTTTNRSNLRNNFNLLCQLLYNAKKVLVMDADLFFDGSCSALLKHLFVNMFRSIRTEVYTHNNMVRNFRIYTDHGQFISQFMDDLGNGKKITVCCGSRLDCNVFASILDQKGVSYKQYTSETDDTEVSGDLRNINDVWSEVSVILYTSKIMVGTDYNGSMDKIYAFGKRQTCSPREMIQMCGRIRNVSDPNIHVFCSNKEVTIQSALEETLKYPTIEFVVDILHNKRNMMKRHIKNIESVFYETEQMVIASSHQIVWAPTIMTLIRGYLFMERENANISWMSCLIKHLHRKHIGVEIVNRPFEGTATNVRSVESKKMYKSNMVETKETRDEMISNVLNMIDMDADGYLVETANRRVKMGRASAEDKMISRVFFIVRHFQKKDLRDDEQRGIVDEPSLVSYLEFNIKRVWNYYAMKRASAESIVISDLTKLGHYGWCDFTKLRSMDLLLLDELLDKLGTDSNTLLSEYELCPYKHHAAMTRGDEDDWLPILNRIQRWMKSKTYKHDELKVMTPKQCYWVVRKAIVHLLPCRTIRNRPHNCGYGNTGNDDRHWHYKFILESAFEAILNEYTTKNFDTQWVGEMEEQHKRDVLEPKKKRQKRTKK